MKQLTTWNFPRASLGGNAKDGVNQRPQERSPGPPVPRWHPERLEEQGHGQGLLCACQGVGGVCPRLRVDRGSRGADAEPSTMNLQINGKTQEKDFSRNFPTCFLIALADVNLKTCTLKLKMVSRELRFLPKLSMEPWWGPSCGILCGQLVAGGFPGPAGKWLILKGDKKDFW